MSIQADIEAKMQGRLATKVEVRTRLLAKHFGTYEGISNGAVVLEVDPISQETVSVPCDQIDSFSIYEPALDRSDELRREQW